MIRKTSKSDKTSKRINALKINSVGGSPISNSSAHWVETHYKRTRDRNLELIDLNSFSYGFNKHLIIRVNQHSLTLYQ